MSVGGPGPLPRIPPVDTGLRPSLSSSASPTPTIDVTSAPPAAIHAAVERGLPLLQKIGFPFFQKTGLRVLSPQQPGWPGRRSRAAQRLPRRRRGGGQATGGRRDLRRIVADCTLQNMFIAGQQDTISYLLFGMAVAGHPSDGATDAQVQWLLRRQSTDGHWPLGDASAANRVQRHRSHRCVDASPGGVRAHDSGRPTTGRRLRVRATGWLPPTRRAQKSARFVSWASRGPRPAGRS